MSSRRRPVHRSTPASRALTGVLVSVLAVAVIALAVLALTPRTPPHPPRSPAPAVSPSPSPSATPTASAPSASPEIVAPGAAERFLAVGEQAMWRASAGQCGSTEPLLERSTDGGRSWTDVTPRYLGIGQILHVEAFVGTEARIVARMGSSCETQGLRTFTQGRFWEPNAATLAAATYVDPAAPSVIVTGAGRIDAPCVTPWSAQGDADSLTVVCDGVAQQRTDGGWRPVAEDAVAIGVTDDGVRTARTDPSCAGLLVGDSCVAGASAGPAALADAGAALWLWAGDAVREVPPA